MRKKTMAWLAIAVAGWLSAPGFAAAEDQTYYGFGDGSNTGNISGVDWRLDKDYSHYGGEASKTHTAKNPLDFKAYEQKWQETYEAKGENVSSILEHIYTERNADDRPSGQVMSSLSMSDVVQVNERYFYVDSVVFQELNVKPFKDM